MKFKALAALCLVWAGMAYGQACPRAADLRDGIVFSQPARDLSRKNAIVYWEKRYRQIDGPYMGSTYVDRRLNTSMRISYAGLFVYKAYRDGELLQSEEPQVDLSDFLKFKPGTTHRYETLRILPKSPNRKWRTTGVYRIEDAGFFTVGQCRYRAVRLNFDGKMRNPDGSVAPVTSSFVYLPELRLRIHGETFVYKAYISSVRKRLSSDRNDWPFTSDAARALR